MLSFCQYRQQGRGQEGDAVVMVYEGVDSIKVVRFIDGFGEKVIFSAEALRQVVELEAFAEHDKGKVPKGGKVEALPVPCVLDEGSRVLIFRCMGKIDFFLIDWNEVDVLMMNGFWEKPMSRCPLRISSSRWSLDPSMISTWWSEAVLRRTSSMGTRRYLP